MANERRWAAVTQSFTVSGTIVGVIRVVTAAGFKVKARVIIQSDTQTQKEYEIKSIPNKTTIEVGSVGKDIDERVDISSYLIADNAIITQPRQKRPPIGPGEIDRATYEEEPIVARRSHLVDDYGNGYTDNNPVPVKSVQLFTKPYDAITVLYPSLIQEIYQSRIGGITGVIQEVCTVNYVDDTKDFILNVARV